MGIRSAIASMPSDGDMQKALVIQRAALHCILLSSDRFVNVGVPLKNQN